MAYRSGRTIEHAELKKLLSYDEKTGLFRWRVPRKGSERGRVGSYNLGYIDIRLLGRKYWAHRLAWFYVYGRWPSLLDHINRVKSDNRISNLREVSQKENCNNRCPRLPEFGG